MSGNMTYSLPYLQATQMYHYYNSSKCFEQFWKRFENDGKQFNSIKIAIFFFFFFFFLEMLHSQRQNK